MKNNQIRIVGIFILLLGIITSIFSRIIGLQIPKIGMLLPILIGLLLIIFTAVIKNE